jgi:hypothetical protein
MATSFIPRCRTCGRDMSEEWLAGDCKNDECNICVNSRILRVLHDRPNSAANVRKRTLGHGHRPPAAAHEGER